LREICPYKKLTPKSGANLGAITGILLTQTSQANAAQNLANSKEARDGRIIDAARQGLKAVENNDELYEWYIMELKQLASRAAKKVASLENLDGNRSGLHFGESGEAKR
jgi:hypothetical protein